MFRLRMFLPLFLAASEALAQTQPQDAETFFELKIRPVLAGTCFKCHGEKKVSNGLRVDSRASLLRGGDSGAAIVPGDPDQSLLIQAIRYHDELLRMPPDKQLSEGVVADFTEWVRSGAAWPESSPAGTAFRSAQHWAFEPVRKISPPDDAGGWSNHPIDRLVEAKLRERGLEPGRPADKRVLIRRAYFDLIGLPPTPEEVNAFLADDSPEAFSQVVDRLLDSPHYGERWGRHWMDLVRYADTAGDNADYPVPEARLYRDYIIDSFNADKRYDEFLQEQLAGDILAQQGPREKYAERVVATGFIALSRRYATAPYELWHLTLEDTVETTGRAFLGLTLRCARCHDHKFDPVTTEDYYALYGFFASTQYPYAGSEELQSKSCNREHFMPLVPADESAPIVAVHQQRTDCLEAEVKRIEQETPAGQRATEWKQAAEAVSHLSQELEAAGLASQLLQEEQAAVQKNRDESKSQLDAILKPLRDELRSLQRPGLPADLPGAYAVHDSKPSDTPIQIRGDPDEPGAVAKRGAPKFLADGQPLDIPEGTSGRLELARWLTRPDNPLVARVMVNRVWQHHFGKAIVGTPSNFGLRGEEPSHPELLDWLAARFVEDGWSIKAMHRLIMLSKTYQLASAPPYPPLSKDPREVDPDNKLYWRYDRRRLDAESIRDSMLAVSGNLDRSRPGPHPFPSIDTWAWTQHKPFKDVYPSNHRSVYLMTQRIQRHPYLGLFDGPDPNYSTEVRTQATVPLQALYMMNNPFVAEQAKGLAGRLIVASVDLRQRIKLAHELAWSRPPEPIEYDKGIAYLERYTQELTRAGAAPDQIELEAWTSYARVMLTANEFVYLD